MAAYPCAGYYTIAYIPWLAAPQNANMITEDSDDDSNDISDFSLVSLPRRLLIKVLEYYDMDMLSCCRLSTLTDDQLKKLAYIYSPSHFATDAITLGVKNMAGFKRLIKAFAVDSGTPCFQIAVCSLLCIYIYVFIYRYIYIYIYKKTKPTSIYLYIQKYIYIYIYIYIYMYLAW
jgi:hypothetical protein